MKMQIKKKGPIVDLLICTPDITCDLFQKCLQSVLSTVIKDKINLLVFDNAGDPNFSHAREMNKAMSYSGRPLFLLDDDVEVKGDWFERMMDTSLDPEVEIVATTVYRNNPHRLWASGAVFDKIGKAHMWKEPIENPAYVPCAASCCWLLKKKRFTVDSTSYKKYHFDSDHTLSNWEAGHSTVIVPATVYHKSGGQMNDSIERTRLIKEDGVVFKEKWMDSGRYQKVIQSNMTKWNPSLKTLLERTM